MIWLRSASPRVAMPPVGFTSVTRTLTERWRRYSATPSKYSTPNLLRKPKTPWVRMTFIRSSSGGVAADCGEVGECQLRSSSGTARPWLYLQDQARDIVMLPRPADEGIYRVHEILQSLGGAALALLRERLQETQFTILVIILVHSFHQTVGENQQQIARTKRRRCGLILGLRPDAQGKAASLQALDRAGGTAQDGRIVAGVDIAQQARRRVHFSDESRGEAQPAETMCGGIAIQAQYQISQRGGRGREGPQAGLERGHQQGRRDALARNVGHHQQKIVCRGCLGALGGWLRRRNSVLTQEGV